MTLRCVAITTSPDTYLDHLVPICYIMQIPLLVTEDRTYASAVEFYPQVEIIQVTYQDLSLEFLAKEYDVIFESGKFWAAELSPVFKLLFGKEMRFVFCPHGNSDKGHSLKNHIEQDISLVYGEHMTDLLHRTKALNKIGAILRTGNYRFPFYRAYQAFYKSLLERHILSSFSQDKKTILYAPTWQDGENPSSFFTSCEKVTNALSPDFNVIVKLHPFLEEYHPAETQYIIERCEKIPNVKIVSHFPAIYSLLDYSDIYLGDFSSIGYDFLAFDKPLYFITPDSCDMNKSGGYFLHRCGMGLPASSNENLSAYIQTTLVQNQMQYKKARQSVYTYAFGEEILFSDLRQTILSELSSTTART